MLGALACSALALGSDAQQSLFGSGGATSSQYGWALAGAGDVDKDGVGDLLVGTSATGAVVRSGQTHEALHTIPAAAQDAGFDGRVVASVGDIDYDGHADFLIGDPQGGPEGKGAARVFSGQDGDLIYALVASEGDLRFGSSAAGLGDVDADGVSDFAVGAGLSNASAGRVRVYSGLTGAQLALHEGSGFEQLGRALSHAGDLDVDGDRELAIGLPGAVGGGRVEVRSALHGESLLVVGAPENAGEFGIRLVAGHDLDYDGTPDLLVGDTGDDSIALNAGAAHVISGADGSFLQSFYGEAGGDRAGEVAVAGDTDGDGQPEVLVGAQQSNANGNDSGVAWLYAVDSGEEIARWEGDSAQDRLGTLAGPGDVSGDGLADVAVGSRGDDSSGTNAGRVEVNAGSSTIFTTEGGPLSVSAGGGRTLRIDMGSEFAGRTYLVLGSLTNAVYSIPLGPNVALPLVPDGYFVHTLAKPNQAPLLNGLGVLDELGQAEAILYLKAKAASSLNGLVVRHSFVLIGGALVDYASPVVEVLLAP